MPICYLVHPSASHSPVLRKRARKRLSTMSGKLGTWETGKLFKLEVKMRDVPQRFSYFLAMYM